jgi:dUTP pyrophosphatase
MKIQLKHPQAKIPTRANPWDAGADLYAVERVRIPRGEWRLVDTGVAIELPDSYVAYMCPRSGLALKHGITLLNSPGVIDSGYRGTLMANIINHNMIYEWIDIEPGDRIAQLVIQQVAFPSFEVAESLSSSQRGTKGHGSSGN